MYDYAFQCILSGSSSDKQNHKCTHENISTNRLRSGAQARLRLQNFRLRARL